MGLAFLKTTGPLFCRVCLTLGLSSIIHNWIWVIHFWQEYHRSHLSFSVFPIWRHMLLAHPYVDGVNWWWSDYLGKVVLVRFLNFEITTSPWELVSHLLRETLRPCKYGPFLPWSPCFRSLCTSFSFFLDYKAFGSRGVVFICSFLLKSVGAINLNPWLNPKKIACQQIFIVSGWGLNDGR